MASDDGSHPHLELAREEPVTERRSPSSRYQRVKPPDDPQAYAELLGTRFQAERTTPPTDIGGYDERRLIKISLSQKISPEEVAKASGGIEIVSQEDGALVLAFATDAQLEEFEARLSSLAVGDHVTYKTLLYALQDFDRWTREDRTGFALKRHGFPETESFSIDAELWPLALQNDAARQREAFEDWVLDHGGSVLDSVRQPYLTVYRIRCGRQTADLLLDHRDVRTVDLPPRIGLEQSLVFQDIQELPDVPAPPADAPGVVVLDTGLVTGHPLLAPAVGDSQSFLDGTLPADDHGHGTFVSGIALYGDVAELQRRRRFVPELRLFSGRVLDHRSAGDPSLIENQVERAVRYFAEAYGCRVFNLSYGNPHRPYRGRHVAGLAVTLDALSRELDVLFVVPTGNYEGDDDGPNNWREDYPGYLKDDTARLLDPAPALNALTVGSLARHERHERWPEDAAYRPVAREGQPSPFTRRGPSVNGALKPDLVDYGGNSVVMSGAGDHLLQQASGAGELSVSHRFAAGRAFAEDSGTSFAAPRVTHAAAKVFAEFPNGSVDLCRALLVAHAYRPPVRTTRVDYRASKISFKMVRAASLDQVAAWFNAAVDAESLARIKERSTGRSLSETARSKGTVQAASWRFTQPSQEIRESRWFVVVTRNDPPWGQDLCSETEPYGLAIALDDRFTPRLQIAPSLHAQTQLRLRERVRARVGR